MYFKICTRCKVEKNEEEFPIQPRNKDNRGSWCRKCHSSYGTEKYKKAAKERYEKKRLFDPISLKEISWKHRGVKCNKDLYVDMLEKQDQKCAICGEHQNNLRKDLMVDHCHKTGRIRGLLCNRCNLMIGCVNDYIDVLLNAVKYLQNV